ncbi:GTP 3',8-cyclase MoaA [Bowmanella sp. JS7-9]|uniref:GTP 3',8-cyclase MoaA n=1 Tax=Pseudobowmanella zhangzhouensis TaxID=1537679 RepID=A0ABW1XEK8_9ALTE|nr:GTP 3',8-cyclase MoaA [Bowmanella sp. JS7-9]TBX20871.1 molybdenum cofactor biosynthesis protein A [Bowmanella sp. JS7-9]
MLEDSFGRQFHYLRLSVTDRCNFRCVYCLPNGNTPSLHQDLSLAEIHTLVSAFARLGTRKVRITGGEPALRNDLADIIGLCHQSKGIEQVALTTNGFNLAKNVQRFQQAGLNAVNISIDSLDPRQFGAITGQDKLSRVLQGVDAAIDASISNIKINTVMLRQFRMTDWQPLLQYIQTKPVTWRFIELMQTSDNRAFFETQHLGATSLVDQLSQLGWQPLDRAINAGPAEEYTHPDYLGRIGVIRPYRPGFCDSCNRLRVSSNGQLHLCLFAERGVDLRDALRAEDTDATCALIKQAIKTKPETHALHSGQTGATRHFAMLGG